MSDRGFDVTAPKTYTNLFHGYVLLALVLFVVLVIIAYGNNDNVHAWARVPSWLGNATVLGLLMLVTLVLAAFATGLASIRRGNGNDLTILSFRASVGTVFVLVGLLLVVAAILVYRTHDFWFAFYVMIVALLLAVVNFVLVWQVSHGLAYLVLPLVVLLAIFVYYLWNMGGDSCDLSNDDYYYRQTSRVQYGP